MALQLEGQTTFLATCVLAFALILLARALIFDEAKPSSFEGYVPKLTRKNQRLSREQCLTTHFEKFGSDLESVTVSKHFSMPNSSAPRTILVAASNKGYKYSYLWRKYRTEEHVPFVLFTTNGQLRSKELSPHYARIPSLLATIACFEDVKVLVYTDMDTLLDLRKVEKLANNTSLPLTITWKTERKRRVLRTNWFIVKSNHGMAEHLLLTWFYNGRNAIYQDQTILNELYARKKWIRGLVNAVESIKLTVELKHCFSALKGRDACMRSLRFRNYVKQETNAVKQKTKAK